MTSVKAEVPALAGGVYLKFKPNISVEQKTQLHQKLKTIMRYRSEKTGIEHILPSNKKEWSSRSSLNILCKKYLKEEIVEFCLPAEKETEASSKALKKSEHATPNSNPCDPVLQLTSEKITTFANSNLKTVSHLKKCELVDTYNSSGGGLSPLWAQEIIGADLAKSLVLSNSNSKTVTYGHFEDTDPNGLENANLSPVMLACKNNPSLPLCPNNDTKNRNFFHGTHVASLVSDSIVGVAAKAKFVAGAVYPDSNTSENFLKTTDVIANEKPDLLCSSMVFNDHPVFTTGLNTILNNGTVMIQGSGNSYPTPSTVSLQDRVVLVGSISPFGFTSGFSSESENVVVLAPSDNFLTSRDAGSGEFRNFSGTSGAQPLVCGAVANSLSFLPGMTSDEVKLLLKKTAIPTINSKEEPKKNGVGTLNALKMVAVAQRLANDWPANRDKLKDDSTYDFNKESNESYKEGLKLINSKVLCEKRKGLDLLRGSFLLNPENKEVRKKMAEVYRSSGFHTNADFYDSFDGIAFPALKKMLEKNINNFTTAMAILRQASKLEKSESLSLFKWGIENATRSEVVRLADGELLKILSTNERKALYMEALIKSNSVGAMLEIAEILKSSLKVPINDLSEQLKKSKSPSTQLVQKFLEKT